MFLKFSCKMPQFLRDNIIFQISLTATRDVGFLSYLQFPRLPNETQGNYRDRIENEWNAFLGVLGQRSVVLNNGHTATIVCDVESPERASALLADIANRIPANTLDTQHSAVKFAIEAVHGFEAAEGLLRAANARVVEVEGQLGVANARVMEVEGQLGVANARVMEVEGQLGAANARVVEVEGQLGAANARAGEAEVAEGQIEMLRQAFMGLGLMVAAHPAEIPAAVAPPPPIPNVGGPAFFQPQHPHGAEQLDDVHDPHHAPDQPAP